MMQARAGAQDKATFTVVDPEIPFAWITSGAASSDPALESYLYLSHDNLTYSDSLKTFPFAGQAQRQWRWSPGLPG